jgi:hypothetical protein
MNAQTDESIIKGLIIEFLDCYSKFNNDTFLLKEDIDETFFRYDSITFVKKTGLEISQKTLEEIMNNSKKINKKNKWKEDELNDKVIRISSSNNTALIDEKPYIKCLSENQLDSIFKFSPTLSVYSISKIIFNANQDTAVFQLNLGKAGRCFSFENILISKVFGKWIVIRRFDWVMS